MFCRVPSQTRIRTVHIYSLMAFAPLARRCNGSQTARRPEEWERAARAARPAGRARKCEMAISNNMLNAVPFQATFGHFLLRGRPSARQQAWRCYKMLQRVTFLALRECQIGACHSLGPQNRPRVPRGRPSRYAPARGLARFFCLGPHEPWAKAGSRGHRKWVRLRGSRFLECGSSELIRRW